MKPLEIWFMDVRRKNMDSGQGPGVESWELGTDEVQCKAGNVFVSWILSI